jgi:hypothetical protein
VAIALQTSFSSFGSQGRTSHVSCAYKWLYTTKASVCQSCAKWH